MYVDREPIVSQQAVVGDVMTNTSQVSQRIIQAYAWW